MTLTDNPLMKTTILLLVSDPIVRSVMEDVLNGAGYMVLAAGDVGQAVDRLKHLTPDLLITRTYVESLPGHDAAKYLRTRCPGMKVLLVGGLMDDERLRDRVSLQNFDIFPKPYTAAALLQKVKDVLEQ